MATPGEGEEIINRLNQVISDVKTMTPITDDKLKKSVARCYETLKDHVHVTDSKSSQLLIYDWHEYFMCIACLAALRSVDPKTKVGACIVNQNNNVVGIGYNCMPGNYDDHKYPKDGRNPNDKFPNALFDYNKKFLYIVHAAVNATLNKTVASLEGCTIYLTMPVDEDCAHAIIQSGIKTVVYEDSFDSDPNRSKQQDIINGLELLNKAGITVVPYKSSKEPKVTFIGGKKICLSDVLKQSNQQHKFQQTNDDQAQETDVNQQLITNPPLTPHQFFMAIAMLSQKKQGHHERDPYSTQGACIVSECGKKVISIGHSGFPDQMNRKALAKSERYLPSDPFIVHAEYNAILAKGAPSLKGCTLYVTKYPCHACAQVIVQAGISRVIFAKGEENGDPCDMTSGDACQNQEHINDLDKCKRHNSYLAAKRIFEETNEVVACGITVTSYQKQKDRVKDVEPIVIDRKKKSSSEKSTMTETTQNNK